MDLGQAILAVGSAERSDSFELFSRHLDPDWIEQALQVTGTATLRRRKIPAEHAVWIVIGMGLLRDRSIEEVVRHLGLALPEPSAHGRGKVTGGAIVQARDRLGPEPLRTLFGAGGEHWAATSACKH